MLDTKGLCIIVNEGIHQMYLSVCLSHMLVKQSGAFRIRLKCATNTCGNIVYSDVDYDFLATYAYSNT
jgi:hypothetical protein